MSKSFPGLIKEMLTLNKVKENEKVILLTPHVFDKRLIDFYMVALRELGADFLWVVAPPKLEGKKMIRPIAASPYALDTLKSADMVLCVRHGEPMGLPSPVPSPIGMYQPEFTEILFAGTRWLDVMLPVPEINMGRLFPTPALIKRTFAGAKLLAESKECLVHVTSEVGTDLLCTGKGRKGNAQVGIVDEPGRWDNFGFALAGMCPIEGSMEGKVVLVPGDYIMGLNRDVTEPVHVTVKDGVISKVEGGLAATMLKKRLYDELKGEVESRIPAHMDWGTHVEGAVWRNSPLFCAADGESYPGMIQMHFGTNTWDTPCSTVGMGGTNQQKGAPDHTGFQLLNANFYLDDVEIVKKGKIVHPNCL